MALIKEFLRRMIHFFTPTDSLTRWVGRIKRDLLSLSPSDIYGDIGAGNGYFTSIILHECKFPPKITILIDKTFSGLAKARHYGFKNLVVADVLNLPFRNNSFTKISAFQLLEHISLLSDFFNETARVTANSGNFVAICPNAEVWSISNRHFMPLLRNNLLRRLSNLSCFSRFFGPSVSQGIMGYESWKSSVGHVRDGLYIQDFKKLAHGTGFCVKNVGTLGRSLFYYYYVDAFNFTFPNMWRLFIGPFSRIIIWAERIAEQQWPIFSKIEPAKKLDGVNVFV